MTSGIVRSAPASRRTLAAILVALAVLAGCDSGDSKPKRTSPARAPVTRSPSPPRSFLAKLIPPPGGGLPGARGPAAIRRLVAGLPLERKVAQLMLVGFSGTDANASFLSKLKELELGGVALDRRNYIGRTELGALTDAIRNAAAGRDRQPPFVVAQQEGGDFSAFPDLPPGSAPGELGDPSDGAVAARLTAKFLKRLGLNGVLAPDVDVGAGGADQLGPRAFSDDPHEVSAYGAAVVSAFRKARMLTAPSHFPGIGAATESTDEGPTSVGLDMAALGRRDLTPFRAAIKAGAPAVLVGHAAYAPDSFVVPASLSHEIETNLLRGGLGFRGIAITDDLDAGAIVAGNTVPKAAVQAVQAGADMVWISGPKDWEPAYQALLAAARSRQISPVRLNSAVARIVTVKRELGLRNRAKAKPAAPVVPGAAPGTTAVPGTTTTTP
ncbi:MAG: glycoside hydrolase family 3 N-terminal domain-containing protein [Thermoleophilaceae bacterium]